MLLFWIDSLWVMLNCQFPSLEPKGNLHAFKQIDLICLGGSMKDETKEGR